MKIRTIAILCLLTLFCSGCQDDIPVKSYLTRIIHPLNHGSSWSYEFNGDLVNPSPGFPAFVTGTVETSVIGHVLIDGELWARVRSIRFLRYFDIIQNDTVNSYDTSITYLSNRARGLYYRSSALDTASSRILFPSILHELWAIDDTTQAELTSTGANLLISDQAYIAYEYVLTFPVLHPLDSVFEYWVPDIGLVKRESRTTMTDGLDDLFIEELILLDYVE